ncbi:DUF4347 domain-containing protein, partial [Hydrocoleum sp. CS-953]|uniref:DUF4347 domain-containing protein n=1 Tax=Hydrocoleum sp. CS-953 TaxID=1671698 RepID=UPI000B9A4BA2
YQGIDIVIIPQNQDGIEVITATLEKYINSHKKLDAIHIFSHGSPGSIKLGDIFLNTHTIKLYKNQIKKWRAALKTTADILLYGCNVAAGIGQAFVNQLQQLTKANIAASVNPTGAYPGDWKLEFTTGKIKAPKVLKPEIMASYNGTLAIITVTNNNDSGAGSLRQAIATAKDGDTIVFDTNLANQTITLTSSQLDIKEDIIIDAVDAPGLTISGNDTHRVFHTGHYTDVAIKNLTIANGRTTEPGAAGNGAGIKTGFQSTLTIENSTFENNVTSGEGGGAIWAEHQSNTTIINSKFDNNDATAGESERGGGAISTNGFAVLTVEDSEFTNNKGINGGAINTPSTALTIENSIFINNDTTAGAFTPTGKKGLGGAIYTDGVSASFGGDNGSIIIRDSLFEHNKGAGAGGAAFLYTYPGDNVVVEDTQVLNNSVIFNDENFAHGGGIRLGTGNSSAGRTTPVQHQITNTTFAGNTAESQGGGLWVQQQPDLITVNIVNSTFSENRTESPDGTVGLGGAIATLAPTTITNTTITNNYAANISGAIHTKESVVPDIEVRNTIFDRNTAGNVYGISQQTHYQLTDRGGNLQFPAVDSDDKLVTANIVIGDPNLGELQEVDGFLVHPLEDGSAAIDAGVDTNAPTTDQLGKTRPVDGDNNGSSITDIGAVEFIPTSSITGDNSDNLLNGTSDDDFIHGLGGNDTLNGGSGSDTIGGGAGNDQLNGDSGDDFIHGQAGNDELNGGDGQDTVGGGNGQDTINGGNHADSLKGGIGNDLINGDSGDDLLRGHAGDDELNGGDGQDKVGGGKGNDIINGNAGNDSLTGWLGNDTLTGGTGNDILNGGDGLDILNGEQGKDTLTGGSNSDRFIFDISSQFNLTDIGSDIIRDFNSAESDKIVLDKSTFSSLSSLVGDGFSVAGEFAIVDSDAAADTSSAKVVYNSANGQLFYNPDGKTSGFGEGGLFATLENQANLQAQDFLLI